MSDHINIGSIARQSLPTSSSSSPSSLFGILAVAVAALALLVAVYLYFKMQIQRKQLEQIERQLKQQISEGDVVQMVMGTMQEYDHLKQQHQQASAKQSVFVQQPRATPSVGGANNACPLSSEPLAQPGCVASGVCPLPSSADANASDVCVATAVLIVVESAAAAAQPSSPSSIEEIVAEPSDAETTDAVMRGLSASGRDLDEIAASATL